jgi:hypothetical protein
MRNSNEEALVLGGCVEIMKEDNWEPTCEFSVVLNRKKIK